jgi:hypothetical protein
MIHLLNDKPVGSRPGVSQTWGIIATLIKQQEQLNVSQAEAADNSKDAKGADTIESENILDDDINDTLDTEHYVFNKFIPHHGDDPDIDVLDLIKIEGTPTLRSKIRILLKHKRSAFATTLPRSRLSYRRSN